MNPAQSLLSCQKPAVKITSFNIPNQVKLRPKTTPLLPRRRPVSSGNMELSSAAAKPLTPPNLTNSAFSDDETSGFGPSSLMAKNLVKGHGDGKNQLNLFMYVIGGRVGQVTVFNGPISCWKLDLTKTF